MLTAHEGGVVELAAAALAVRIDVVDGEIIPGQFGFAARMGARAARGVVPDDPALFGGEASLDVLPQEQAAQDAVENLLALAALAHVVSHLGDGEQVLAIKLLVRAGPLHLPLHLAHFVHLRGEGLQKIPSQFIPLAIGQDQPFLIVFADEHRQGIEVGHLPKAGGPDLREHRCNPVQGAHYQFDRPRQLTPIEGRCRHDPIQRRLLVQDLALNQRQHEFANQLDVFHPADLTRTENPIVQEIFLAPPRQTRRFFQERAVAIPRVPLFLTCQCLTR